MFYYARIFNHNSVNVIDFLDLIILLKLQQTNRRTDRPTDRKFLFVRSRSDSISRASSRDYTILDLISMSVVFLDLINNA